MTKYQFRIEDGGTERIACDCCLYKAPLAEYPRRIGDMENALLCEVCSGSLIGNDYLYNYHDKLAITRNIAFCTNSVLDQLGKFKDAEVLE